MFAQLSERVVQLSRGSFERCSLRCSKRDDGEIFNYIVDNIESFIYRNYDIELITPTGFF